jgi:hypothetical protein
LSVGFRSRHDSGWINPKDEEIGEDDLLGDVSIDHDFDVPFVAGMSKDGKTLYVDHEAFKEIKKLGYLRELIIHEMVEHLLMSQLGLPYKPAHAIATGAEEAAVRAKGIPQSKYDHNYDRIIRMVSSRGKYPNVPKDLDLEPYKDEGEEKEVESAHEGMMGASSVY